MAGLDDMENRDFLGSGRGAFGSGKLPLQHYLLILLHRKWLVLAISLSVSVGSAVFTFYLPDIYKAETVVLIDPQQVPERYVESSVTSDVRNRLGSLSQQILSATRLQRIIDRFNLYAAERKEKPPEAIIELMRSHIELTTNFAGRENAQREDSSGLDPRRADLQAFGIVYSGRDPRIVAQVTNELASLFIEENLKARERMAIGTNQFIESQLGETRKALEKHEASIRDFKSRYFGELPDQQPVNMQVLDQLQRQLQDVNNALEQQEDQKTYLLTLLKENSATTKLPNLSQEEIELPALQARYSEQHPDVQRTKRIIEEQQRAREEDEARARQEAAATNLADLAETVPSTRTFAAVVQLKTVEDQIARRTNERARAMEDIAVYKARVEMGPRREQQLSDLERDYKTARDYYGKLLEKKLSAETGTELELRQMGEQFSILDPALVPKVPSAPNRPLYIALGLLAGMILGPLLVLGPEILGFGITITSPEQLATVAGVALLGVVSVVRTQREQRRRRWKLVGTSAGVVVLVLVGVLLLYHFQFRIL
jgi:polysaccharide chain length determinant protein (PEP-CTERM system associated)